jgi:predicted permease
MANFILIFVCMILGVLLKRTGKLPDRAHQALNTVVIYVSLPAMVLVQIPALLRTTQITSEMLIPISMAWILFLASFLIFIYFGRKLGFKRPEIGALVLTAGLGNTSFVGFPLLEALIGPSAIPIGVLVDQLGSFLVLSTVGLIFASAYSPNVSAKVTAGKVAKGVFLFPPFVALVVSILWFLSGTSDAPEVLNVLGRLSGTLVPLALIAVGIQLRFSLPVLRKHAKALIFGLGYKLLIAPLLFYVLYVMVFRAKGFVVHVTLLEAAMAPMITSGVIAEEFGFDPEISSLMIGVGIPLSLITVVLWERVFQLVLN